MGAAKNIRDWVGGRNYWSSKQFPLKNPYTDLLRLTPSEIQHWGSSLKGTSGIQRRSEVSGIKASAGGQLSPRQKGGQRPLSLFWTFPPQSHRAGRMVPYLRLHQPGWHCLPHPRNPLRLLPTQFTGPPKQLTVTFSYKCLVLAHAAQLPKSSQTSNSWPQWAPSLCTTW